ncbi:D-alanyl-D-alanine carboxypeptidase family protein [Chelatococcus asaccharovorans]|uniref:D-alanyl-D-alanine carboxypeptidase family protein n=1 Tax=Chelatococcus asaccharovorans TaxID=28210 RepID=UPI00224C7806|nr:D-alanyl-D-alanine carboxypeptidase family protein [Chelatococcus asaccharovorans]CAH1659370.1 D-alanyl-D-alanine carboxypeptidase [Chelatococcus asaccharovorans]CAH1684205.1 D-alanyl-D-alanine carboxypeptidase [Chelatococcus asaccharovorans]
MTNVISRWAVAPFVAAAAVGFSIASIVPASANPTLVVDVASGRVLKSTQASDLWYPASLTKLMTTYLVFQEIKAGRLALDTPLKVSARAAAEKPSKIGVKPGTEVTVDNALKMMLVKSANDIAVVLAEGVSGSVEAFVARMNATAQSIGMYDSYFANPNGMPDDRARTSARDLAVLARSLIVDFSPYRGYFEIGSIQLGKRTFQNTNGLVGRYPGSTGMKTGFICASGFNVVATAQQGNRELLTVVLGAPSAVQRTIQAAELFDAGFAQWGGGGPTVDSLPRASQAAPANLYDEVCGKNRGAYLVDDDNAAPVSASAGDGGSLANFFSSGQRVNGAAAVRGSSPNRLGPREKFVPLAVFIGRTPGAEPDPTAVAETVKPKSAKASRQAAKTDVTGKTNAAGRKQIEISRSGKGAPAAQATAFAPVEQPSGSASGVLQKAIKPAKKPASADKATAAKATGAKATGGKATEVKAAPAPRPAAKGNAKPKPLSLTPGKD